MDISAKIEAWDKPSVIAVANDHTRALLVTAETKQAVARLLKGNAEQPPEAAGIAQAKETKAEGFRREDR